MICASTRNTLSGLKVRDAMRRQIVRLPQEAAISQGIAAIVKYKTNALLAADAAGLPVGVVSKTDIMGAYYAELPLESPLAGIMSGPLYFCAAEDSLESALDVMRERRVYRLYVKETSDDEVLGVLAYPDIVGLLYKYCHACEHSRLARRLAGCSDDVVSRYRVRDVMTPAIEYLNRSSALSRVIEALSRNRFGALLIASDPRTPQGVVSKTDLVLAFNHRTGLDTPAEAIMSSPVRTCAADDLLEDAIRRMILDDVQRVFVRRAEPFELVGVLSLSDMARIRSGSCHACMSSRITVGGAP
jgi:CBS domain-containing protein